MGENREKSVQSIPGNLTDYDDSILSSETVGELSMKLQVRGVLAGIPEVSGFLAERAMGIAAFPDDDETRLVTQIFRILLESKTKKDKILGGLGTKLMFSTIMLRTLDILSSVVGPNEAVNYEDDMRVMAFVLISMIIHRLDPHFIGGLRDKEGNNPLMVIVRSTRLDVLSSLIERTGYAGKYVDSIVERDRPLMEAIFGLLSVGCDPNAENDNGKCLGSYLSDEFINSNIETERVKLLDKARKLGIILEKNNSEKEV